jgi:hypothetical protein
MLLACIARTSSLQNRLHGTQRSEYCWLLAIIFDWPCPLQLSALAAALPGVDLCHISPAAVVKGNLLHIHSLLVLLAEISHTPEGSQPVCQHVLQHLKQTILPMNGDPCSDSSKA